MKKILLTSAGFENVRIREKFLEYLDKNPDDAKVLFITTAAVNPVAVRILTKCLGDLTSAGIKDENITVYDMHKLISKEEILIYDAIYVCGGDTNYLMDRVNELHFNEVLNYYAKNGGIYIGVSAGSLIASNEYPNGLKFLSNNLGVHSESGSKPGNIVDTSKIYLTDKQAICIEDNGKYIIE